MEKIREILFLEKLNMFSKRAINHDILQALGDLSGYEEVTAYLYRQLTPLREEEIRRAEEAAEEHLERLMGLTDVTALTPFDPAYPEKLMDLGDSKPLILYQKGNAAILGIEGISVVGTRSPAPETVRAEEKFIRQLCEKTDMLVISGLALGCDSIAHRETLRLGGKTAAVLPSGFNKITPRENEGLADEIVMGGGLLVSEYAPWEEAKRYTFAERDGVIAALGMRLVVAACRKESGTMITVREAEKMGRRIGCLIPDRWDEPGFELEYEGNRFLVNEMKKEKIEDVGDILRFLYLNFR